MQRPFHLLETGDIFTVDITTFTRDRIMLAPELRDFIAAIKNGTTYLVLDAKREKEVLRPRVHAGPYKIQPIKYLIQPLDANHHLTGTPILFDKRDHSHEDSEYIPCTLVQRKEG